MGLYRGNTALYKVYKSSIEINKVYRGSTEVYSSFTPTFDMADIDFSTTATNVILGYSTGTAPSPNGQFIMKPDGTRIFGGRRNGTSYQWGQADLSTAFDTTTIGSWSFYTLTDAPSTMGCYFKNDGTTMWLWGRGNNLCVEYSLSTAWNLSTASKVRSRSITSQVTGGTWGNNGSRFIIQEYYRVIQYTASTPYRIDTIGGAGTLSTGGNSQTVAQFNEDGTKYWTNRSYWPSNTMYVRQFNLGTAWDITSSTSNTIYNIHTLLEPYAGLQNNAYLGSSGFFPNGTFWVSNSGQTTSGGTATYYLKTFNYQ